LRIFISLASWWKGLGLFDARAAWIGHQLFFLALVSDFLYKFSLVGSGYGSLGVIPKEACSVVFGNECLLNWSFFGWADSDSGVRIGLAAAALLCLLLLVGRRQQWIYFVLIFLVASFRIRFPFGLNGGDYQAPWLILAFSLLSNGKDGFVRGRAFLWHVLVFYCVAGFAKSGSLWSDGLAVSYALGFTPMRNPIFELLAHQDAVNRALTFFVLYLERGAAFLLLIPMAFWRLRLFLVLTFMLTHLGMALTLHTTPLVWYGIAIWTVFIPKQALDYFSTSVWIPCFEKVGASFFSISLGKLLFFIGAIGSLHTIPYFERFSSISTIYGMLTSAGLEPNWRFFAPDPLKHYGERRFFGQTSEKTVLEIEPASGALFPPPFSKSLGAREGIYSDRFWSRVSLNLSLPRGKAIRPEWLAHSLCGRFSMLDSIWISTRIISIQPGVPKGIEFSSNDEHFSCK
jgi:hypothetical protein